MSTELYSVLAMGMRYWFALLGVVIVLRTFWWLHTDRRAKHRRLRRLPDAGMIGEMVVLAGSDELPKDTAVPVPREGVLGCLRTADIVVPCEGVAPRHLDLVFVPWKGVAVRPWRGRACTVDGEEVTARSIRRHPVYMHHGSILVAGGCAMRLRLFAGLEAEYHSRFMEDAPQPAAPQSAPQPLYPQEMPQNLYPQQAPQPLYPQEMPQPLYPQEMAQNLYPQDAPQNLYPQEMPQNLYPQEMPQAPVPPETPPQGLYLPEGAPRYDPSLPYYLQPRDGDGREAERDGER